MDQSASTAVRLEPVRTIKAAGFAAADATTPLAPFNFQRQAPGPHDVQIEILYCGVCHSDLHQVRNEWGNSIYPMVPGHEIVGRVVEVGDQVTGFKPGDLAGVGCLVDSCQHCASCDEGLEQYCENGMTLTYNDRYRDSGEQTFGGYSDVIVVRDKFVLKIPASLDLKGAAPLLCAGITTYSPLRHWNVQAGDKVGIVGLGGLGHMGVKFAHAFGAHTVLFTTSPGKTVDAKRLGADDVVISKDEAQMKQHLASFDFILNTVAAPHNLDNYIQLLKRDGTMCLVGAPDHPHPSPNVTNLLFKRRQIAGSLIGGIRETQEMLEFCAKHNITSDVEVIEMHEIENAYARMLKGDVKYRFVIDMASLQGPLND